MMYHNVSQFSPINLKIAALPEHDRPAFELVKENKKFFVRIIHGNFLRNTVELEIDVLVKQVCTSVTEMRIFFSLSMLSQLRLKIIRV
jgi:hypothetical protein